MLKKRDPIGRLTRLELTLTVELIVASSFACHSFVSPALGAGFDPSFACVAEKNLQGPRDAGIQPREPTKPFGNAGTSLQDP